MNAIEFNNVWEKYRIKFIHNGKISWEEIWALKDISFGIDKGEVLGIIGENGAGKTTLLKLVAGMLVPDRGEVDVSGRVSTLMELGAGFNPELTGRENVTLNARLYGLDERDLEERIKKIIDFSGLGKFIDAPIKYYSQGMYMRLAFALAIFVEPDILLIDDILAVGDEEAQQKCIKKIFELKQTGKTIVVVSHDMNIISKLCNRVILLEKGKIIKEGLPGKVILHYLESVGDKRGIAILEKGKLRIVFNNGRLNLSYAENLLTKGMGGYVSFFNPSINSWFSSFNLTWQIKDSSSNKIIAEGCSHSGSLSQIWVLQLEEDFLQWQVEIKEEDIKESHIDLVLIPQYKKWLTLEKEDNFPLFSHKSNWQDLGLNNFPEGLLGVIPDSEIHNIPNVILETQDKDSQIKIFNSGYEEEAHIIQAYLNNNLISIKIRLFPDKDEFKNYIEDAKKQFLHKQQEELVKQHTLHSIFFEDLRLFADKETKSIRLYYKDKEITKDLGFHTSFLNNKVWRDTSVSEWQVKKENNTLIIELFWKHLGLNQTWKFSFKGKNLLWQIESLANKFFNPDVIKFGLLLTDAYKTFFCGNQQTDFPEEALWKDISLESPKAELFGLRKENDLPAIVLNNKKFNCIIINNYANSSCRVLHLDLPKDMIKNKNFSFDVEINFLENDDLIDTYLTRLCLQRTVSSGNLRIFADLECKTIRLYYKDKEITKGRGLGNEFCISKKWFLLSDAQWQIQKVSENELILTFNYESLPLSQIWNLICKKDTLEIKIELDIKEPISFTNYDVRLELLNKFRDWLTPYEQGNFLINQYINNIAPIRLKESKISKFVLRPEIDVSIPELLFESLSEPEKWIFSAYKSRVEEEEDVCLNFSLIIPKKEGLVNPGKYIYFKGKIALDKRIKLEEESILKKIVGLNKGNLKFIFDSGRSRIFWGQKELTLGLGVYTSVRSSGIWYDSHQAKWQINLKDDNKIIVTGDWPYIPISQIWQIKLIDKNLIFWMVEMEVYGEVNIEIEQINLMLSSEYKTWLISNINKGEFLDEFVHDYDILPFRFWYGKPDNRQISVESENLPSILFKCNLEDKFFRAIIENTDYLYKARLLQYQKSNVVKLLPKKYTYFAGEIKIEPKE